MSIRTTMHNTRAYYRVIITTPAYLRETDPPYYTNRDISPMEIPEEIRYYGPYSSKSRALLSAHKNAFKLDEVNWWRNSFPRSTRQDDIVVIERTPLVWAKE